jgi:hypothetical protein
MKVHTMNLDTGDSREQLIGMLQNPTVTVLSATAVPFGANHGFVVVFTQVDPLDDPAKT